MRVCTVFVLLFVRKKMSVSLLSSFSILLLLSLSESLIWYNITRPYERGALCNDFSPAGYFIRRKPGSTKWLVFLEGGGGCNTPVKCNERFIDARVRKDFTTIGSDGSISINVARAWSSHSKDPLSVISPLMTSLWRYSLRKGGRNSSSWRIKGKDLLSTDRGLNPSFHDYNHVLIPYCSSDLWLRASDFSNYTSDFRFDPLASSDQFTFRGSIIYKAVIGDLFHYHGLSASVDVILAGSSAGGIGAMSHAKWTLDQLPPTARLSLITDSAWFIDFKDIIKEQFKGVEREGENGTCPQEDDPSLCISAPHLLTNPTLFPDIPTFALFSQYDLYVLALSLTNITVEGGGGIIELMRVVSEYSGSMATTLQYTSLHFSNLSYYVTSCFHHVYFATSDLWGDETAILGNEAIDETYRNNRFIHKIESDIWRTFTLTGHTGPSVTISSAIQEWLSARDAGTVVGYTESCRGPRCNPLCPEDIILGELGPVWGYRIQLLVSLSIVAISALSLSVKASLYVWYKVLERRQRRAIESGEVDPNKGLESNLPICEDRDAISVSCLNLRYSVTLSKSALKKGSGTDAYNAQRYKRFMSVSAGMNTDTHTSGGRGGGGGRGRHRGRSAVSVEASSGEPEPVESGANVMLHSLQEFQKRHQKGQKVGGRLKQHSFRKRNKDDKKKEILRGISAYFNPGEMVAVMGPSGCGKTTFIDLLAGRQNLGSYSGKIIVNGYPMERVREWYVSHTGYVLQLASPYYESLTVRENLTLAAQMRLAKSYTMDQKLNRVEQILRETGLTSLANTVVGSSIGPGLSGGQKRRLCVALQLLNMPSLIFLDEPTSGLDSLSSLELLTHLNNIASSNRTVILTIHQPRLEIYHMFSQIILLCQGQVAYHGIPDNAYQFFVTAHLNATLNIARLKDMETKNPADMIVDMLASEESRLAILDHYKHTQESQRIKQAIRECVVASTEPDGYMYNRKSERPSLFDQVAALEARAKKKSSLSHTVYLPVIFSVYGFLLGTVFPSTGNATFILAGFGVFSCASGLFMFPAIYNYLYQAMQIFSLEYSDGIGHTWQLVFQTFTRFVSISAAPVIVGASAAYALIIPFTQYNLITFGQMLIFNLSLNQTWIALLIFVIMAIPQYAHRVSPVLSAIAGFAGGFFIPPSQMPKWYSWLFYINPNYYGFAALMRVILPSLSLHCSYESSLECYPTTGEYLLTYFSLDQVNPMLHVLLLLLMTGVLLVLSWASLFIRHAHTSSIVKRFRNRKTKAMTNLSSRLLNESYIKANYSQSTVKEDERVDNTFSASISEHKPEQETVNSGGPEHTASSSSMIQEGQTHEVWIPGRRTSVRSSIRGRNSLEMRRRSLLKRVSSISLPSSGEGDEGGGGGGGLGGRKHGRTREPNKETLELRRKQWSLIEEREDNDSKGKISASSSFSGSLHIAVNKNHSIIEEEGEESEEVVEKEESSSESVFFPASDIESTCLPPPSLFRKRTPSHAMYSIQEEEDCESETGTVIAYPITGEEEERQDSNSGKRLDIVDSSNEGMGTEDTKIDDNEAVVLRSRQASKRPLQMMVISASKRKSNKFVTELDNAMESPSDVSLESELQASETEI